MPDFSAGNVITVMDAGCSLCARGALMKHYGLDPADPTSWLYLEEGRAYSSLDALIRVGRRLGGVWKGLCVLRILPTSLQNTIYCAVARNRYRIFGTTDLCMLPNAEVQKRLLV